jgi:hypothetical protein
VTTLWDWRAFPKKLAALLGLDKPKPQPKKEK